MENQYTINEISSIVKVSKQSLYNLIKKNQSFVNENSRRIQRKVYYNQSVLDFFVSYYHGEGAPETPKTAEDLSPSVDSTEALKAEIDALKAEIDTLRKQLATKEEEHKELIHQNGALILTISQLQQEKMLLLPAPKKSIGERIKGLFHAQEKA